VGNNGDVAKKMPAIVWGKQSTQMPANKGKKEENFNQSEK
jgi:hypothetical protein